jgi:hypothetical protein
MRPVSIDLQAHPDLQFRIDGFSVPAASRGELEAAMRRNLAFLETLPGFLGHVVFERTSGESAFDLVTIAVWESRGREGPGGSRPRHSFFFSCPSCSRMNPRMSSAISRSFSHCSW